MENLAQEQIQKRLSALPTIIREAINDSDWEARVRRIISINNLRVDQGTAVEETTLLTMLGLKDPRNFLQEIKKTGNLSEEQGRKITTEVGEEIFQPIKSYIIKVTRRESGLPEERDTIDEIIYGKEEDQLEIYNIESSLESEREEELGTQEQHEAPITREEIAHEMKKDVEIMPVSEGEKHKKLIEKEENMEETDLMAQKLKDTTRTETEEQSIDPYRESII